MRVCSRVFDSNQETTPKSLTAKHAKFAKEPLTLLSRNPIRSAFALRPLRSLRLMLLYFLANFASFAVKFLIRKVCPEKRRNGNRNRLGQMSATAIHFR